MSNFKVNNTIQDGDSFSQNININQNHLNTNVLDENSMIIPDSTHLDILTPLSNMYIRTHRSDGKKSLRCFPFCCQTGHNMHAYCGRILKGILSFRIISNNNNTSSESGRDSSSCNRQHSIWSCMLCQGQVDDCFACGIACSIAAHRRFQPEGFR